MLWLKGFDMKKKTVYVFCLGVSSCCVINSALAAYVVGPGPGSVTLNTYNTYNAGNANVYSGATGNDFYGNTPRDVIVEAKDGGVFQASGNLKIIGAGQVNLSNGGKISIGSYMNLGDRNNSAGPGSGADKLVLRVLSGSSLSVGGLNLGRGTNDRFTAIVDGKGSILSVGSGWAGMGTANGAQGTLTVSNGGRFDSSDAIVIGNAQVNNGADRSKLIVKDDGSSVHTKDIKTEGDFFIGSGTIVEASNALTIGGKESTVTLENSNGGQSLKTPKVVFTAPGTLVFNTTGASESLFSSAIEGIGNVNKTGDGTTRLTGDSSKFGGALNISEGGIIADGSIGDSTSSVNISGTGLLSGAGDVQGQLNIQNGGEYKGSGSIKGDMVVGEGGGYKGSGEVSGGIVVSGLMAGSSIISGNMNIEKTGKYEGTGNILGNTNVSGVMAGTSNVFGNLHIESGGEYVGSGDLYGPVSVSGIMAGESNIFGSLSVASLGIYQGAGTVTDDLIVNSGGSIAPGGEGVGSIKVSGNSIFKDGSLYNVTLASNGESDLIDVKADPNKIDSGKVIIGSDVKVLATAIDPQKDYRKTQVYTILKSANGIDGNFAGVSATNDFLTGEIDKHDTFVNLAMRVKSPDAFKLAAQTKNQYAVAGALSGLRASDEELALFNKILDLGGDFGNARKAFDALSGEFYASSKNALIKNEFSLGQALNQQLLSEVQLEGQKRPASSVWVRPFSERSRFESNQQAAGMTNGSDGMLVGADIEIFDDARIGAMAGVSHSKAESDSLSSKNTSDNYHFGVYGTKEIGLFSIRGGVIYGKHEIDSKRNVSFPGYADRVKGSYNASTLQTYVEADYKMTLGNAVVKPFVNLSRVDMDVSGVQEKGGAGALNVSKDSVAVNISTTGVRSTIPFQVKGMDAALFGSLGWQHTFGDTASEANMRFGDGEKYQVSGVKLSRNAAIVGLGVTAEIRRNVSVGVAYSGNFGDGSQSNGVDATLKVTF